VTAAPLGDRLAPGMRLQRIPGEKTEHPTPVRHWCPDTDRPDHLWWGYHCRLDKHMQSTYGLTCDDYHRLLEVQGGRCAICGGAKLRTRRLVVEHSHLTGEVRGLAHFTCNRILRALVWWIDRITRYLLDPPGRQLGLVVPPGKRRRLESKYQAKAAKAGEPRTRKQAKPQPSKSSNGRSPGHERLRAMTKQGGN
jgi:Recombination endonuclease VII